MSWYIPGHYATCLSVSYVALAPWCPAHGASWAYVYASWALALRIHKFRHREIIRDIDKYAIFEAQHVLDVMEALECWAPSEIIRHERAGIGVRQMGYQGL